jgi:phosphoenolpyruvate-protein phosphotransferase
LSAARGRLLRGIAGAPGIAIAPAWRYVPPAPAAASSGGGDPAIRIREAAGEAASQLEILADRLRDQGRPDEAEIFGAQALMATDPSIVDDAVTRAQAGADPVAAVSESAAAAAALIASVGDELLAARAADVRDVGARIGRILNGAALDLPEVPSIAVADDLPPSVTAEIPPALLRGVALESGSPTAHAVILSRSLSIPAVVGIAGLLDALDGVTEPVQVGLDGARGEAIVDPSPEQRAALAAAASAVRTRQLAAAALRGQPCATADGHRVTLAANIGTPDDAARAIHAGAEGVGLFRTEFLFMRRQTPPTEAEQTDAYRRVFEAFGATRPVIVRLADIGGDKAIPYLELPPESNPFLGVRAIRLAYDAPELLLTQLRAIWSAGGLAGVTPHVMAPMVATRADVQLLLSLRDEAKRQLQADGRPSADHMVTGIMVEVPAAAIMARQLAPMVDFLSVGTNDLTQYLMAADRGSAPLAALHDALHPAVLRTIAMVVDGATRAGIRVGVCGELAGDPLGALLLVGLGVDELSADAASLDDVRAALASVAMPQLRDLVARAVDAPDAAAVRAMAQELVPA